MRALITRWSVVVMCFVSLTLLFTLKLQAQDEPIKARLGVEYHRTMGEDGLLHISAKYKFEKKYLPATDLKLNVYAEYAEDSIVALGETITNSEGIAEFVLSNLNDLELDSVIERKYVVAIEDNERFRDLEKSVKFIDAFIKAGVLEEEDENYILAQLLDVTGEPLAGEDLQIKVQRLFAPLVIGESSYETDEEGNIAVELEEEIPSKNGDLIFEVILDGKKYGIVKDVIHSDIGKKMDDLSTFDQRTMWSPPGKTPIFLLVLSNILILGIWSVIAILILNLIKINKS